MSQQLRPRVAAAVAMFFGAVPLPLADVAAAAPTPGPPVQESGREVVFTGDSLLGVSCAATPSVTSVTVRAESSLRVVNETGHRARLLIDGAARGEVADGGAADVLFHRGPVSLTLKPTCVVTDESSVTVHVVPARPGRATRSPAQSRATASAGARGATADARRSPAEGGAEARDTDPGTTASLGDEVAASATDRSGAVDSAPAAGGADGPPAAGGLAAEPLASVEPVRDTGPVALLALIATVAVVGVSAGAIRAILAQRATRTSPA